ncbi:MAG TPA: DUF4230 domain-containing protein [Chthoniobacterales bacterium]|nr:DUF4230 domain-containing protein [Chthoniobacterales bacterium]
MNSQAPGGRRKFSWPLAFTLIVLIVAAVCTFVFLRIETWPGRAANQTTTEMERVGRDVRDAFVSMAQLQPRVTVNNRIYLEKTTATAQLAILSRQVEVEQEFQHTWAGSTKRVKLHATFAAKAGFDLQRDVAVDLRPEEILISLPHASILGVEQKQVDVLAFENGFWNRISAADLESQLGTLPELARQKAEESGILAEAETAMLTQLKERIHAERPVHLVFQTAAVKE